MEFTDRKSICYIQFLHTKPPPADFVAQNIEEVRGEPREKKPEDRLDFGEVYNYAGQYLQYFDMQVCLKPFSALSFTSPRCRLISISHT